MRGRGLEEAGTREIEREERERSSFKDFISFFVSCFGRRRWVREIVKDKYVVFRERTVTEGLIDFRGGASSDGLSVCGFGGGVLYHVGIAGEDFQRVLRQSWDALVA